MQLITFTLEGYRRFVDRSSMKLHADMIALVGPNEAGKSSILKALGHLNHDDQFSSNELPRRSAARPLLKWQLQLEEDDRASLSDIPEAGAVERVEISKGDDGLRKWAFFPEVTRDRRTRSATAVSFGRQTAKFRKAASTFGVEVDFEGPLALLTSEDEFGPDDLELLSAFIQRLSDLSEAIPAAESSFDFEKQRVELQAAMQNLIETEQLKHPAEMVVETLEPRIPQVRLFELADRDLQREYDLAEVADAPPPALRHLAGIAELDLPALRGEISSNLIADASTRRNEANRKLVKVFASWNQENIAMQFEFQGTLLIIQTINPSDSGLSSIDDRSEGMRWFAALLAFTSGAGDRPILLADEIETHLHYDAQSDLLEVLARQSLISKVIYTTHSFGCLPYDIGNGVRVVQQTGPGTSKLANGFWHEGSGFSPLLASMGAAAVSFTPTRRAVVGEGATEAILLPSLLRQATDLRKLDFQVTPGLASVAAAGVANLETEAGQVAYLVDGDVGGQRIKRKLIETVPEQRVIALLQPSDGAAMETEDLVDPEQYARALTDELALWNSVVPEFRAIDLPATMRTKSIEAWCKKHQLKLPDKGAVAQRLANRSGTERIFDPARKQLIIDLYGQLVSALSYAPPPAG